MPETFLFKLDGSATPCDCGGKGNGLNRLIELGFEVPVTYCLFSKAYERFLERNNLRETIAEVCAHVHLGDEQRSHAIANVFYAAVIPDEIKEAIGAQKIFVNKVNRWAVRSSSNFEDMRASASAGIYESFMNVAGLEEILSAVKKTWASLWSARAIAYRRKSGLDDMAVGMAVIIQQMVDAVYSGVLFTVDPIGESDNRLMIEYCQGCGDPLVSGAITPYVVEMDREGSAVRHIRAPAFPAIGNSDWITLRDSAMRFRAQSGAEQDIEWAWDDYGFHFLQSRPITGTVHQPRVQSNKDLWTRANVGEVLPGPVTPLTWRIFLATLVNRPGIAFSNLETDASEDDLGIKLINGRAYIRLDRFLDSFCYLPFVNPKTMNVVLGLPLEESFERYAPPHGIAVRLAQLMFLFNAFRRRGRIQRLADKLPDRPLAGAVSVASTIDWAARCFRLHLKATAYAVGAFALLNRLAADSGKDGMPGQPVLFHAGSGYQTADQGIQLAEFAHWIRSHHRLHRYLAANADRECDLQRELAAIPGGPEFLSKLDVFMRFNGARTAAEFELAVPRWKEDPSFVLAMILSLADSGTKGSLEDLTHDRQPDHRAHERAPYCKMGFLRASLFKRVLGTYQRLVILRENLKYRLMEGYADLRHLFLKAGQRLAEGGRLQKADDIFFLTPAEIKGLESTSGVTKPIAPVVERRRKMHETWRKRDPAELVTLDGTEAYVAAQGDRLTGIGCSAGIAVGPARVILNIDECQTLVPGEILVTQNTDPGWTPLFLICKAVVTETGGVLSHGATVAREYGVPAVSSIKDATKKIRTGDIVQVDGRKGEIILKK